MTTKTYKTEAAASVHETMEGLYKIGLVDKETMRHFDDTCLTEIPEFTPDDIRALRLREEVSQPVFARHLNVSKGLISQWERGGKTAQRSSVKIACPCQTERLERHCISGWSDPVLMNNLALATSCMFLK